MQENSLEGIPQHIKNKYKIVWEIPMKHLIDMAKDRGAFICQSQSLNLWVEEPNYKTLTSMHFYSWEAGLKTGIYYLRRKAKHQAQQFTIEPNKKINQEEEYEGCEMCSLAFLNSANAFFKSVFNSILQKHRIQIKISIKALCVFFGSFLNNSTYSSDNFGYLKYLSPFLLMASILHNSILFFIVQYVSFTIM